MSLFKKTTDKPTLIAHRGYSQQYPENTMLAMQQAFNCGACYVECDVQLTKDKVPVLMHDRDLLRAAGVAAKVHELNYAELKKFPTSYSDKFADKFTNEKICSLGKFVECLQQWPGRAAFIEVKRSSIREFGVDVVLHEILPILSAVRDQVAIISFNKDIIRQVASTGHWKTGWIAEEWSDENNRKLAAISPDYFFIDYQCLPAEFADFQKSSCSWVLYEIDDPELADKFVQKGVRFIETNDIGAMLQADTFSNSGCSQ